MESWSQGKGVNEMRPFCVHSSCRWSVWSQPDGRRASPGGCKGVSGHRLRLLGARRLGTFRSRPQQGAGCHARKVRGSWGGHCCLLVTSQASWGLLWAMAPSPARLPGGSPYRLVRSRRTGRDEAPSTPWAWRLRVPGRKLGTLAPVPATSPKHSPSSSPTRLCVTPGVGESRLRRGGEWHVQGQQPALPSAVPGEATRLPLLTSEVGMAGTQGWGAGQQVSPLPLSPCPARTGTSLSPT